MSVGVNAVVSLFQHFIYQESLTLLQILNLEPTVNGSDHKRAFSQFEEPTGISVPTFNSEMTGKNGE